MVAFPVPETPPTAAPRFPIADRCGTIWAMTPAAPPLPAAFAELLEPAKTQAIQKVRYSHDAMIDIIVANPGVSQGELARSFGYTEGWVSQVISSDAFQNRLAERKQELVDPLIRQTLEERFKALVHRSQELLLAKLDKPATQVSDELVLRSLELTSKALGYGARGPLVQQNTQYVVNIPPKADNAADWMRQFAALPPQEAFDGNPG